MGKSIQTGRRMRNMQDALLAQDYTTLAQVKALVAGLLDFRGAYDPTGTSLYPTSSATYPGSGESGAIMKGDWWIITADGTMHGKEVRAGDVVYAVDDTADVNDDDSLFALVPSAAPAEDTVTTSDTTPTTIKSVAIATSGVVRTIKGTLLAFNTGTNDAASVHFTGTFKNLSGTLYQVGDTVQTVDADAGLLDVDDNPTIFADFNISGTDVQVNVTGLSGNTINWKLRTEVITL